MMVTTESCVPPGFRFHPTDEELVGYYLKKKVASQKIDLDVIREIDLYRIEPWDLKDKCRIGYEEQSDWYFFSHKDKKYPTGTRTNRATVAGFWKATGRDKAVYNKNKLIGMRKTLVFYKGRAPNGQKTDWIMHEYRLESDENGPPQEEGWVVCRAFKKRTTGTGGQANKSMGGWDSAAGSYFYDEPSSVSSVVDPVDPFMTTSRRAHNNIPSSPNYQLLCKQETPTSHAETLTYMHSDHFVKLPQLESPSLPLIRRPSSSMSLISSSENNNPGGVNYNEEVVEQIASDIRGSYSMKTAEKVTDWRALDKFVASQLSQEQRYDGGGDRPGGVSSFGTHDLDMAAVLLMSSGVHYNDNGLCIFDQRGKNQ